MVITNRLHKTMINHISLWHDPLLSGALGVLLGAVITVFGSAFLRNKFEIKKTKRQKIERIFCLIMEILESLDNIRNLHQDKLILVPEYDENPIAKFDFDLRTIQQKMVYCGFLINSYIGKIDSFSKASVLLFGKDGYFDIKKKFSENITSIDDQVKREQYAKKHRSEIYKDQIDKISNVEKSLCDTVDDLKKLLQKDYCKKIMRSG